MNLYPPQKETLKPTSSVTPTQEPTATVKLSETTAPAAKTEKAYG